MKSTAKGIKPFSFLMIMTSFLIVCIRVEAGKSRLCLKEMEMKKSLSSGVYVATHGRNNIDIRWFWHFPLQLLLCNCMHCYLFFFFFLKLECIC